MIADFQEKARKDYKDAKEVFDKHGLKFFAFCGTALGAVRDNDFIAWDYDIDLASIFPFSDENKQKVIADLRAKGFDVTLRHPAPNGNLFFERGVKSDLYWMSRIEDDFIYHFESGKQAIKIPAKYLNFFKEYKLGDSTVLVPNPPGQYLAATYDNDYLTVKKDQIGKIMLEDSKRSQNKK